MRSATAGPPPETEAGFQAAVIALARACGWQCYHTRLSWKSERGFPDLVCVKPGEPVIYAELKTNTGKVTIEQAAWLAVLTTAYETEVYLWRPKDWEAIQERLRRVRP